MLPERSGFEVCRILRKEFTIPILMLTAKGEEVDKSWITYKDKIGESQPPQTEISKEKPTPGKDAGAWLEAGLPALYGRH